MFFFIHKIIQDLQLDKVLNNKWIHIYASTGHAKKVLYILKEEKMINIKGTFSMSDELHENRDLKSF